MISIVMPLYNKEAEVGRAIRSVLAQRFADFELIVVDDGSIDGGPEVVRSFDDERISLFRQENAGVSAARNRGIALARHDLVAFLDADDEWDPGFLEVVLNLRIDFPDCGMYATCYQFRHEDGSFTKPIIRGLPGLPWRGVLPDYFAVASRSDPPVCSSAVAVSREAICRAGMFPAGIAVGEDLLTWARMAVAAPVAYSTETMAVFWLRAPMAGMPTRVPSKNDPVGTAFRELMPALTGLQARSFRRYLAMWHRMRAAMFMQVGDRRQTLRELGKMAGCSLLVPQLYVYGLIAICPPPVVNMFNALKNSRRALYRRSGV